MRVSWPEMLVCIAASARSRSAVSPRPSSRISLSSLPPAIDLATPTARFSGGTIIRERITEMTMAKATPAKTASIVSVIDFSTMSPTSRRKR